MNSTEQGKRTSAAVIGRTEPVKIICRVNIEALQVQESGASPNSCRGKKNNRRHKEQCGSRKF
jgi:hypothetical protein